VTVDNPAMDVENWKSLGLPSVKQLKSLGHVTIAEPAGERGVTVEDALEKLRLAVGVLPGGNRSVTTPVDAILIRDSELLHVVEKRTDARERYAHLILPTLQEPTEVWLSPYDNGEWRKRYIKLFSGPKYDMLVVVKTTADGSVMWNSITMEANALEKQRKGKLLWRSY
jgi:hypothetical protein